MTDFIVNHPNVMLGAFVALVFLTSFKGVWRKLNDLILKLLRKTPTTMDETLYLLVVGKVGQYLASDAFKDHWKLFLGAIGDLQLSQQEIDQIKFMFATQMSQELVKLGISAYDEQGKQLVEQTLAEFSEFMKKKYGNGWCASVKVSMACGLFSKWLKNKLQRLVDANRVKTSRVVIRRGL